MALPATFLDELRARTPLVALIGRRMRLTRSGRQHKGCCPFHGEKTPSFHVYDDHFHCFGCGVHGDAISFVMQSEGASFPEAVERLAAEAGMEVPQPSAAQAQSERRRLDLHAVLEAAQQGFVERLAAKGGEAARAYLRRRGVANETVAAWGLGWSGPGRGDLASTLHSRDITQAMMADAGLMRLDEKGGPAGELFFNRVTFPIRDGRGRILSFGGRTLGDGAPKYLNGPETELFSKRRTLFGLDAARAGVRAGQELALVEGYMDVIALHQAGLSGAVAPLGTAVTEEQLAALWALSPMPVLCFDGDAAGARAAVRAVDLALPMLSAERSLKVARLPPGQDPDSLVRAQGPVAMAALLRQAPPLGEALFDLLREGTGNSPEARAALRTRLDGAAARIGDKVFAREVRSALLDRFFARPRPKGAPQMVVRSPVPDAATSYRELWLALAGLLLRHPELRHHCGDSFGSFAPPRGLEPLAAALVNWHDDETSLDFDPLMTHLSEIGLAETAAQALSVLGKEADPPERQWRHFSSLMHKDRLDADIARATALTIQGDPAGLGLLTRFVGDRLRIRQAEDGLDD